MRHVFAIVLCLAFAGCVDSIREPKTGKVIARWSSDRQNFYYCYWSKDWCVVTGSASALFSPVIRANWHGGSNFVTALGTDAVSFRLAGAPGAVQRLLSGAPIATTAVTNRPIRSTPTPAATKTP
jgi:hypothetical protein